MRLLIYTLCSPLNASSRIHAYNYERIFKRLGADLRFDSPFPPGLGWVETLVERLMESTSSVKVFIGRVINKVYWVLVWRLVRTYQLLHIMNRDIVVIQKGLGRWFENSFFERAVIALVRRWGKKFVYHFDDQLMGEEMIAVSHSLIGQADLVVTVNEKLCDVARPLNRKVVLIPENVHSEEIVEPVKGPAPLGSPIVIGWIGLGVPYKFEALTAMSPALQRLSKEFDLRLKVVSNRKLVLPGSCTFPVENIRWTQAIDDHFSCDIAINPVPGDMAAHGKGSYKLLKCMAFGIPSVTSWTSDAFSRDGDTCLHARTNEEWYECLLRLITDGPFRVQIINNGIREAHAYSSDVLGRRYFDALASLTNEQQ